MKISKTSSNEERQILTGMIVDAAVCGRLAAQWRDGMFRSKWANLIAGWCVAYFEQYNEPPNASLEGIFDTWADKSNDDDTVALVDTFMVGLSDEYEAAAKALNPDYVLDVAGKHFNQVRLENLATTIQAHIDQGDAAAAQQAVNNFSHVELGGGQGVDILTDEAAIRQAFEQRSEPIIAHPGDLGVFYGDAFERDGFIAYLGATGRGKTWWLLDIAWRAMRCGRKVAFFEVGDMSQSQIMRRFMVRASHHPTKAKTVSIPKTITVEEGAAIADVSFTTREYTKPLDLPTAWKAANKLATKGHKAGQFKLSCHPNSSINVGGINSILRTWERDGWVPDVVVVDYADILAPPNGIVDSREQINHTWKQLRSLSQTLHCCVVTATQSDAASYDAALMQRHNFSEDRRKLDHVTGMVGINMSEAEKDLGVVRLNWLKRRDEEYSESRCVHVAGSLHLGCPSIISSF